MKPLEPVSVIDLLADERAELLALLSQLSDEQWAAPTVCAGWSVKDIALHLLGDDVGVISRKRDGFIPPATQIDGWEELVAFLNRWNAAWVEAARRISTRLLITLLELTGREATGFLVSRDQFATGGPVSWAGPGPAPVWLDTAREYTERWLHQQQIRDAVDRPGLKERRFLKPVLQTFVRALPHTFRDTAAAADTRVRIIITGEAGGAWLLVRGDESWTLHADEPGHAEAEVELDQETAWRLFTKGLDEGEARERSALRGDEALAATVLRTVAIIA